MSDPYEIPNELAYDLRQSYAQIVAEHMRDVATQRKANNFYLWFKALQDLHTQVQFKFKKETDETDYEKNEKAIIDLANTNKISWQANNDYRVEKALRQLEMFLYKKMNEAKMFGEGGRIPGL